MKAKYIVLVLLPLLSVCCNRSVSYDATGTFEATEITISSEIAGKLIRFSADEGMRLNEGQEIGLIDTVQLYLQKLQLQASMKSVDKQRPDIEKQIASLRQQIATAEREKQRVENLLKSGAANQKQLDDLNAQIALLHRQQEAQTSTLRNSAASLNEQSSSVAIQIAQIEDKLRKCRILSPIDGVVLAKYTERGELATAGKPLFKIADTQHIYLRAYVTSEQLFSVKLGQDVRVYADFGKDARKEYKGRVTWIYDRAEFTPKTILTRNERANQVYAVKIAVENDGTIKIGMYGEVVFN